jgi:dTMP kinase
MDLNLSRRIEESFRLFQGRILEEYDAMAEEMGFHIIDATGSIEEQQLQMRQVVMQQLGEAIESGQILHKERVFRANPQAPTVL